jgi:ribosomal protein S18 acetylase RimI-like enzyme
VIEIRPLHEGDLDQVAPENRETIKPDYVRRTMAEREGIVWLVALVDSRPVGRLGIDYGRKADEGVVHLWAFDVVPELQRRGIGTAMMREAESLIASDPRGATEIEIGADEDNHDAAKLYRRLGYAPAGDERGSNGELIYLFRRRLD